MSSATLAATASCWPTERSRHHSPNSSVYSTSHGMQSVYDYLGISRRVAPHHRRTRCDSADGCCRSATGRSRRSGLVSRWSGTRRSSYDVGAEGCRPGCAVAPLARRVRASVFGPSADDSGVPHQPELGPWPTGPIADGSGKNRTSPRSLPPESRLLAAGLTAPGNSAHLFGLGDPVVRAAAHVVPDSSLSRHPVRAVISWLYTHGDDGASLESAGDQLVHRGRADLVADDVIEAISACGCIRYASNFPVRSWIPMMTVPPPPFANAATVLAMRSLSGEIFSLNSTDSFSPPRRIRSSLSLRSSGS